MGREGENLAEQSDGIIVKMDELGSVASKIKQFNEWIYLEKEYETTYETFMGELKKNNDIVQGIREKIARIEMDNWSVEANSILARLLVVPALTISHFLIKLAVLHFEQFLSILAME